MASGMIGLTLISVLLQTGKNAGGRGRWSGGETRTPRRSSDPGGDATHIIISTLWNEVSPVSPFLPHLLIYFRQYPISIACSGTSSGTSSGASSLLVLVATIAIRRSFGPGVAIVRGGVLRRYGVRS